MPSCHATCGNREERATMAQAGETRHTATDVSDTNSAANNAIPEATISDTNTGL